MTKQDVWEKFSMSKYAHRSDRDDAMVMHIVKLEEEIAKLKSRRPIVLQRTGRLEGDGEQPIGM